MPITSLTVKDANGSTLARITGVARLASTDPVHITSTTDGNVTVYRTNDSCDNGKLVYNEICSTKYITSINGLHPTVKGNLIINGSGSFDIYLKSGYDDGWKGLINAANAEAMAAQKTATITEFTPANELHVNDISHSCKSCAEVAALQKLIEYYNAVFVALKDASIERQTALNNNQSTIAEAKMKISEGCDADIERSTIKNIGDYDIDYDIYAYTLLYQYVIVVHMYNWYIWSKGQDNTNDKSPISPIPDTDYGFGIDTRFPMPTCDGDTDVECEIEITPVSGQDKLSVYIPDPDFGFYPGGTDHGSPMEVTVDYESASDIKIKLQRKDDGSGTVKYGTSTGTWNMQVKVMPFYNVVMKDNRGEEITIDDSTPCQTIRKTIVKIPGGTSYTTYENTEIITTVTQVTSPSREVYVKAHRYIKKTATVSNVWKVRIKWRYIGGKLEREVVKTYYTTTPGVPEVACSNLMTATVFQNYV